MTEPARSMAASLANLEAHRPPEPRSGMIDDIRVDIGRAVALLAKVRNKSIDVETNWRRQHAAVSDELARLDAAHDKEMAQLAAWERWLEIMRGEV